MSKSAKGAVDTLEGLSAKVTLLKSELSDLTNLVQKTIDRLDNHDSLLTQMPKPRAKKDPNATPKLTCQTMFIKEFIDKGKGDKAAAKEAYKNITPAKKEEYKTKANAYNLANNGAPTKPKKSSKSDVDTSASASTKKSSKKNKVTSDSESAEESSEAPVATKKKSSKKHAEKAKEPVDSESSASAEPVATAKKSSKKAPAAAVDNSDEAPAATKKKPVAGKKTNAAALQTLELSDDETD